MKANLTSHLRGERVSLSAFLSRRGVDIETEVSPLFLTYFMMDWAKLSQEPSGTSCLSCGEKMMSIEPIRDKKGVVFDGLVCHKCKTVLWARRKI